MRKNINTVHIEGYLYQHDLSKKVTGEQSKNPGTEYISGKIEIATDEEGLNVVPIHFTYSTEVTANGKTNATYGVLSKIIDGAKTWISDGKENALKLSVNTAFGLNDFYAQDGNLVSQKRCEGGFVSIVNKLNSDIDKRNTFEADMVITKVIPIEANEERKTEAYDSIRGCFFDFRNSVLPTDLSVKSIEGMSYFENLGVSSSSPVYTKVWGNIVNKTIIIPKIEQSGFGEAKVSETTRSVRDWEITGVAAEPYEWNSDTTITASELQEAMQNREVKLAEVKKRQDDYNAQKNVSSASSIKSGSFNF
jgi:hypothetical protein